MSDNNEKGKTMDQQKAKELVRGALGGWVICDQTIQRVEVSRTGRVVGYVRVVVPAARKRQTGGVK